MLCCSACGKHENKALYQNSTTDTVEAKQFTPDNKIWNNIISTRKFVIAAVAIPTIIAVILKLRSILHADAPNNDDLNLQALPPVKVPNNDNLVDVEYLLKQIPSNIKSQIISELEMVIPTDIATLMIEHNLNNILEYNRIESSDACDSDMIKNKIMKSESMSMKTTWLLFDSIKAEWQSIKNRSINLNVKRSVKRGLRKGIEGTMKTGLQREFIGVVKSQPNKLIKMMIEELPRTLHKEINEILLYTTQQIEEIIKKNFRLEQKLTADEIMGNTKPVVQMSIPTAVRRAVSIAVQKIAEKNKSPDTLW
jgi:hypothetical protein